METGHIEDASLDLGKDSPPRMRLCRTETLTGRFDFRNDASSIVAFVFLASGVGEQGHSLTDLYERLMQRTACTLHRIRLHQNRHAEA